MQFQINYAATRDDLGLNADETPLDLFRKSINKISVQSFDPNTKESNRRAASAVINICQPVCDPSEGLGEFLNKVPSIYFFYYHWSLFKCLLSRIG